MSKTVMLIHGAWLTPASWEKFRQRYEARGYTVVAPPWPLEDQPIEELRRSPHPDLGKTTVRKIIDHYDKLIRALPEPPILIGHSAGGLWTQMLLDRGLGSVGVAIDPVPFRGVIPRPRMLLSALPVFLTWRSWSRVAQMSFEQFATNFAQGLPPAERRAAYDRYVIGTPGRIYWQGVINVGNGIHAGNPKRPPLLLIAGENDRIIPVANIEAAYKVQRRSPSPTGYKLFPGRSHFLVAEPGWEEVADYALDWAVQHQMGAGSMAAVRRAG